MLFDGSGKDKYTPIKIMSDIKLILPSQKAEKNGYKMMWWFTNRNPNSKASSKINPAGKGHTIGGTGGDTKPIIGGNFKAIHNDYVLDFTSPLQNVIMKEETGHNDFTYRFTYGLHKENVVVYGVEHRMGNLIESQTYSTGSKNIVKLYYHRDHLGSSDYLTANKDSRVKSYASYDNWGKVTENVVVMDGGHSLDLAIEYTGYNYDNVLRLYYAKARMYDPADRRFMAVDPVNGNRMQPETLLQYIYCLNNPFIHIDPTGMWSKGVHLGDTKTWAKERFSEEDAGIIAKADNDIDELFSMTNAVTGGHWHFNANYKEHATDSEGDSRKVHFREEKQKALDELKKQKLPPIIYSYEKKVEFLVTKGKALKEAWDKALEFFGKGLHAIQDIDAHQGWQIGFDGDTWHRAYYAKFYENGQEKAIHSTDKEFNPLNPLFDRTDYDISLEKRKVKEGLFTFEKWVYVARPGTRRYEDTRTRTKDAFKSFANESVVMAVRSLIKIYKEMRKDRLPTPSFVDQKLSANTPK